MPSVPEAERAWGRRRPEDGTFWTKASCILEAREAGGGSGPYSAQRPLGNEVRGGLGSGGAHVSLGSWKSRGERGEREEEGLEGLPRWLLPPHRVALRTGIYSSTSRLSHAGISLPPSSLENSPSLD